MLRGPGSFVEGAWQHCCGSFAENGGRSGEGKIWFGGYNISGEGALDSICCGRIGYGR